VFSLAIFWAAVVALLQIKPPFPTNRQPGEELVRPCDGLVPEDTPHATSAAISANQNASVAPTATFLATRGCAFV
jgi:hypothetical protein